MVTSQKAAVSLLISVLLFGIFAVLAFTGLFDLIETRFYNPSITASIINETSENADAIDRFFAETQARFSETLNNSSVRRSFLPDQNAEGIFERSRIYGLLAETLGGFQWVRFIDSGGSRIHFSTYGPDILNQDRQSLSYQNYREAGFPYEEIAVENYETPKYIFDEASDRILFSFPFYDSFDVYRGTALFALSVRAVSERLVNEGRIKVSQDISVIRDPQGLLSGMSTVTEKSLVPQVSSVWKEGGLKTAKLVSPNSGLSLALISVKTSQGFFVGRLVNEELFSFPQSMKIILLVSFLVTVYLIIFLCLNVRQDAVTIVQNRMKQLQISLIEQFYERKGDADWNRWRRELEQRRDEISAQLKQGIKTISGKDDIDALIDRSWSELLSVMGNQKEPAVDEERLQIILNRILAALPAGAAPAQYLPAVMPAAPRPPVDGEVLEELAEEVEPVEVLEELTEEAEPVEVLEELTEEVEPAELLEELTEEVEPVEVLEELTEEVEPAELLEELTEEAEPVEVLEELVETVEAAGEIVELEELEELEEAEELEDIESPESEGIAASPSETASVGMTGSELDRLASQIEFSGEGEPEISEYDPMQETNESMQEDLEIVSPFSNMHFDFKPDEEDAAADEEYIQVIQEEISGEEDISEVEEISETHSSEAALPGNREYGGGNALSCVRRNNIQKKGITGSLPYEPFFGLTGDKDIEVLEALPDADQQNAEAEPVSDVIEEREGIHYISGEVLSSDSGAAALNQDFKKLVDSIIE